MRNKSEILDDVRCHPEIDAFRYEYADAIEAKDPEHAEYIRERVRTMSLPKGSRPPTRYYDRLEARIAQPLLQHCYEVSFVRGFIEEITVDPFIFIDRGHQLLEAAPILKVVFSPKPLPAGAERPLGRTIVPSPIRELMGCALLDEICAVSFVASDGQRWWPHVDDIESILEGRYLSKLLIITLPEWDPNEFAADQCKTFWTRAFDRPEFRKMLTLELPGYPGERRHDFDDNYYRVSEVLPMPAEGRALEQRHGYLPSLHLAAKWGTSDLNVLFDNELILAAQRGELPMFPVGAPVTDEMYAAPPRKKLQNLFD